MLAGRGQQSSVSVSPGRSMPGCAGAPDMRSGDWACGQGQHVAGAGAGEVLCDGGRSAMTHLYLWELTCDVDVSLLSCVMLMWHAEPWRNPLYVADLGLRWREADSGACNDLGGVGRRAEVGYQPAKGVEFRQSGAAAAWRWSGDQCTGEG